MRRFNVIKVIPVNITHGAVIGKDKSFHSKKVYHVNSLAMEEDEDLDIRDENDDYHEKMHNKKISFIRQITLGFFLSL